MADQFDRNCPEQGNDHGSGYRPRVRRGHVRECASQPTQGNAGQGDMPDAVAEHRESAVDQVGADDRRRQSDDECGQEGTLHHRPGQ